MKHPQYILQRQSLARCRALDTENHSRICNTGNHKFAYRQMW